MEHSKYAPSSSSRWIECPGSAGAPDDEAGEEAALGTYIHGVASGDNPERPTFTSYTPEQVQEALDTCLALWNKVMEEALYDDGDHHTETRVVSKVLKDVGGTLDHVRVSHDTIHVYDLKTGMGPVSAEDNPQLAIYLILAKEIFPGRERFFGTIVQPRLDYVSTYEFTAAQLANLRAKVASCIDNSDLRAGAHCQHCPLLPTCETAFSEAQALLAEGPKAVEPLDETLPEDIARWKRIVEFAKVFEELEKVGRMHLLGHIQAGGTVAGWKAANQGSKRYWIDEEAALAALAEKVSDPASLTTTKIISPAQAEKLGIEIPEGLIFKPPAKTVLAKRSSPKTEVIEDDGSEFA